ncbi:MAG: FMN-binding protein [Acidobacteria bacterium]|nr:FMN-binding protein [Acidobacteriota bacterium]MCB9396656.1 FMN-binding protein [Acidobacteriota bacterium]
MRHWIWLLVVGFAGHWLRAEDYLSIEAAQAQFFGSDCQFQVTSIPEEKALSKAIKKQAGVALHAERIRAWKALRDGKCVGWVFEDNVIGKHEFITYAVAVAVSGEVLDVAILSYRETHGGEIMRPEWLAQFKGKTVDQPFKIDVDIDGISGATLSVRNVSDGVKKLLVLTQMELQDEQNR